MSVDNLLLGKGSGYFKISNPILLDTEYQNRIKKCIDDITSLNENCNPNRMWELIKSNIRNETICYCSSKNKATKKNEEKLISEIKHLEEDLMKNNSSDLTDKIIENIKTKKEELEQLYEKKVNGHILRSKAIHIEGN